MCMPNKLAGIGSEGGTRCVASSVWTSTRALKPNNNTLALMESAQIFFVLVTSHISFLPGAKVFNYLIASVPADSYAW